MTAPVVDDLWPMGGPDVHVAAGPLFGLPGNVTIPAYSRRTSHVPAVDPSFMFHMETTRAILAGFAHNRRVLIQGFHGTGKSTHIEQVAARLNWPCVRINLDGHISRLDLVGKDGIVVRNGQQVTEFQPGILPWALDHPIALVLDEYDAGRPDVLFVIQRVLEDGGRLTLLDPHRVITPHAGWRLFATANTVGLGDATGMYAGTQPLNQGQLDRWHLTATLNFLPADREQSIVQARLPSYRTGSGPAVVAQMVALAGLTRDAFQQGHLSTQMSLRTVITFAENALLLDDVPAAFRLSFLNRCDEAERSLVGELFQRCFDLDAWPMGESGDLG